MSDKTNDQTNDHDDQSDTPSGPEGQDTSENMDETIQQDPETTEVLPAQVTPPTQKIPLHTQQLPDGPAPDGEVHPAYGVAAARAQQEERTAADVHDAPVPYDADPLAPLREPAPTEPATPVVAGPASPASSPAGQSAAPTEPVQPVQPTQAVQPVQPVEPAQPQVPARRGVRVGTAVWGLIVIAVGLGVLAISAGVVYDLGVALIVLMSVAGVILVGGSVVSSIRRR